MDYTYLPEDQLAFLTRMLDACKMNTGDVAIVNLAKAQVDQDTVISTLEPEKIISFGPVLPGIKNGIFSLETIDKRMYLQVAPLDEFVKETEEAKQLKGKLWTCLKQMFAKNLV
jgi:hypothetical protein